jgi:hypothetical protein
MSRVQQLYPLFAEFKEAVDKDTERAKHLLVQLKVCMRAQLEVIFLSYAD